MFPGVRRVDPQGPPCPGRPVPPTNFPPPPCLAIVFFPLAPGSTGPDLEAVFAASLRKGLRAVRPWGTPRQLPRGALATRSIGHFVLRVKRVLVQVPAGLERRINQDQCAPSNGETFGLCISAYDLGEKDD